MLNTINFGSYCKRPTVLLAALRKVSQRGIIWLGYSDPRCSSVIVVGDIIHLTCCKEAISMLVGRSYIVRAFGVVRSSYNASLVSFIV